MNSEHKKSERGKMKAALKMAILHRDNFTCQHCFRSPLNGDAVDLHIDHIIPVGVGGFTEPDNLQTLCRACNGRKQDRLLPLSLKKNSQISLIPKGHTFSDLILFLITEYKSRRQDKKISRMIDKYQELTNDYNLDDLTPLPEVRYVEVEKEIDTLQYFEEVLLIDLCEKVDGENGDSERQDRAERIRELHAAGLNKTEIAREFGYTSNSGSIFYVIRDALDHELETPSGEEMSIIEAVEAVKSDNDGRVIWSKVTRRLGWTAAGPNNDRIRDVCDRWGVDYTEDPQPLTSQLAFDIRNWDLEQDSIERAVVDEYLAEKSISAAYRKWYQLNNNGELPASVGGMQFVPVKEILSKYGYV